MPVVEASPCLLMSVDSESEGADCYSHGCDLETVVTSKVSDTLPEHFLIDFASSGLQD